MASPCTVAMANTFITAPVIPLISVCKHSKKSHVPHLIWAAYEPLKFWAIPCLILPLVAQSHKLSLRLQQSEQAYVLTLIPMKTSSCRLSPEAPSKSFMISARAASSNGHPSSGSAAYLPPTSEFSHPHVKHVTYQPLRNSTLRCGKGEVNMTKAMPLSRR